VIRNNVAYNALLPDVPPLSMKEILKVSDKNSKDELSCYVDAQKLCRTITFAVVFFNE
jgi:hypothetical protein